MKLSEAIRAGAKIRQQAHGTLYNERHRFSWRCFVGRCEPEKTSCALGAAYEAGGGASEIRKAETDFIGRDGKVVKAGEQVEFLAPHPEWTAFYLPAECCQCERKDKLYQIVAHLNDDHEWTREEIALWVERVENSMGVAESVYKKLRAKYQPEQQQEELPEQLEWPDVVG